MLFSCSSPLVLVPSSPIETIHRADYREFDLYITSFAVNDLEEIEDINQVRLLKTRFFDYLKSQNQFHQIHDGPRSIGQKKPGLSLAVNITPQYTSHRTWFLEVITFYPFLGLWPITPHWGETTVKLSAQLVDMYGTLLKNINTTKHMDYSSFFYAVYRSDHVQDAFRECYHMAFKEASTVLKNYQPQVTAYVDSVLFYSSYSSRSVSTGLWLPCLTI